MRLRNRVIARSESSVHVDVDQVGAAPHLVEGDVGGLREVVRLDQPSEARRTGDVRALPDHLEVAVRPDRQRLEAGVPGEGVGPLANGPRCHALHGSGDGANVIGRRPAAAADDVDEARFCELAHERRRFGWLLLVLAERVR
jgi:hypothetical protein